MPPEQRYQRLRDAILPELAFLQNALRSIMFSEFIENEMLKRACVMALITI